MDSRKQVWRKELCRPARRGKETQGGRGWRQSARHDVMAAERFRQASTQGRINREKEGCECLEAQKYFCSACEQKALTWFSAIRAAQLCLFMMRWMAAAFVTCSHVTSRVRFLLQKVTR